MVTVDRPFEVQYQEQRYTTNCCCLKLQSPCMVLKQLLEHLAKHDDSWSESEALADPDQWACNVGLHVHLGQVHASRMIVLKHRSVAGEATAATMALPSLNVAPMPTVSAALVDIATDHAWPQGRDELRLLLLAEADFRLCSEVQHCYQLTHAPAYAGDWIDFTGAMQYHLSAVVGYSNLARTVHHLRSAQSGDDAWCRQHLFWIKHNRAQRGSLKEGDPWPSFVPQPQAGRPLVLLLGSGT